MRTRLAEGQITTEHGNAGRGEGIRDGDQQRRASVRSRAMRQDQTVTVRRNGRVQESAHGGNRASIFDELRHRYTLTRRAPGLKPATLSSKSNAAIIAASVECMRYCVNCPRGHFVLKDGKAALEICGAAPYGQPAPVGMAASKDQES